MQYILDTANENFIKRAVDLYPISGVTTNPSIISKEKRDFKEIINGIRSIIGKDRMLHIQCLSTKAEDIFKEGNYLNTLASGNCYIKVPVTPEGYKAMRLLKAQGIKVTATAIFTAQQALMAAEAGADYVAPYVNRLDNICSDGVNVVSEIVTLFNLNSISTNILAASFKNVEQIHKVSLAGAKAVTVNEELFEKLITHPLTDWSVNNFINDWEKYYGFGKTTLDV